MKTITAMSALAFLAFAAPAFADDMSNNGVVEKTAPGGMNNGVSAGDQRGMNKDANGVYEGRSSANDYNGKTINDNAAPGGMNNGASPALQHSN